MKKTLVGLCVAATMCSPVALAEDMGWYVGASVGRASVDAGTTAAEVDADLAGIGITATSTLSEDDTGYKLFAGYQINRNLAVEGGYVNLGDVVEFNSVVTAPAAGAVNLSIKNRGWNLDVVGILPINDAFSAFGKVGAYHSKTTISASATGGGAAAAASDSDTETNLKYGLGVNYAFSKTLGVRAEWERYNDLGDENVTGEADVDLWSVGMTFKF